MSDLKALYQEISEEQAKTISEQIQTLSYKDSNTEKRFRVVASTEDTDRSGEVIKVHWRDWKNFMKNPVIIANHVYKIENIVGKATDISVKDNQLVIEGVFSQANPLWKLLSDLYEEWMVKTVSVWFIPTKRQADNAKIITNAELLELSFVAVPCNPNALSLDQKQLLEENWMLEEKEENETDNTESIQSTVHISEISQLVSWINEIKLLLQTLVDGKTKGQDNANFVAKETFQEIARVINKGLSDFKKAYKS